MTGLLNRLGNAALILKYPRAVKKEERFLLGWTANGLRRLPREFSENKVTKIVRLLVWEYGTYDGAASAITRKDTARRLRKD
jgi:type II restriction/modification system DNA methylase subunit YeeA